MGAEHIDPDGCFDLFLLCQAINKVLNWRAPAPPSKVDDLPIHRSMVQDLSCIINRKKQPDFLPARLVHSGGNLLERHHLDHGFVYSPQPNLRSGLSIDLIARAIEPLNDLTQFGYDLKGNLLSVTDTCGATIYTHDRRTGWRAAPTSPKDFSILPPNSPAGAKRGFPCERVKSRAWR